MQLRCKFFKAVLEKKTQFKNGKKIGNISLRFIVTKQNGNAVKRNYIRRRLREAVRNIFANNTIISQNCSYRLIIIGFREAINGDYVEITQNMKYFLQQHKIV